MFESLLLDQTNTMQGNVKVYLNLMMTANMEYIVNAMKRKCLLEKFTHFFFSWEICFATSVNKFLKFVSFFL